MGVADGMVLGLTKIHDTGLPTERWNLVIVAEGYTTADQGRFQQDAQDLLDYLFNTPPFDEGTIACAINIYRLDVVSNETGADDPDCNGEGTGTSVDTYFDATFCANGVIRRALSGDGLRVQDAVEALFPEWHQIVVIVNSPTRGGSGGSVAWFSNGAFDWRQTFVHELSHTAFDLADEYDCYTCEVGESGQDQYTGNEPDEPNITTQPDPALVKWSALVTAGPEVPTQPNQDCTQPNTAPSPVPVGTVGTFEGAGYFHCGLYRPEYSCIMRSTLALRFCSVCTSVIRQFYMQFVLPATSGSVLLNTPSVVFNDIPEDVITHRAASFSVDSCVPVTFLVTMLPAAPFELVSPAVTVAPPAGSPPWKAYVWFRYSCDTPGTMHNSSATIRCLETGELFNVNLTANCVTRPTVAVQLVFDKSGSMLTQTDEGRTREQVLRDSAQVFANLLYDDNGVGLNAYDEDPHPILDVQTAGAPGDGLGRDALSAQIASFTANPDGFTSIGDGIELARNRLDAAGFYDHKAMIVLTDGNENKEKRIGDVADSVINQKVFAIGMGTASQIQPAALDALTSGTGGYLLMTGNLTVNETFLLAKYYLQILAGVNNNDIILDPEGHIQPGNTIRIPFDVIDSDIEITGVVISPAAWAFRFEVETPSGKIINEHLATLDPAVEFRSANQTVHIRVSLPQIIDNSAEHGGRWHLVIQLEDRYYAKYLGSIKDQAQNYISTIAHGIRYSANVHTYSNLQFRGLVLQNSYEPGAVLTVRVHLTEFDVPFQGHALVVSELLLPDITAAKLIHTKSEPGIYEAETPADQAGVYRFRVRAIGRTSRGENFSRELLLTAPIWHQGDSPVDTVETGGDELCRLLDCLLESGAISGEARKYLEGLGVNLDQLHECICKETQNVPGAPGGILLAARLTSLRDQLSQLIRIASSLQPS